MRNPAGGVMAAFFKIFLLLLFSPAFISAGTLDFTTIRLGHGENVVLVVGGIQGDEPGGFSAASLLATHYEIQKGHVWVVPNLNFPSMIKRSRGLHGDMNRKFAALDENDPEFETVRRIQELICHPDVRLVLNLHDGSGFYRHTREDKLKNPNRWGQSIIIDQETLAPDLFMGNLGAEALQVAEAVNAALIKPLHAIHVRNTHTALGDKEMEKSLSWFAMRKGKAAFGLEASKEFPVHWRAYYHLSMIENFLKLAGVEFSRDFALSPEGVEKALSQNLGVSFAGNRIFLPLENARARINYLPMPVTGHNAIMSKPIMAVLPCGKASEELCIHYGNRTLALIRPEWREITEDLDAVPVQIDGKTAIAPFGQIIEVQNEIIVEPINGFRVNAIGFDCGKRDESGQKLRKDKFEKKYSVDRAGTIFRVEIYKDKSFAGMFLLRFGAAQSPGPVALPSTPGPESSMGF